jgi:hypothetical protein
MRSILLASFLIATLAVAACGPSTNHTCTACGDESCIDIQTDPLHCGECDNACLGSQVCAGGECVTDPGEMCDPGETGDCYTGPSGTDGVAGCHGGTRECLSNGYWGSCEGEVTPTTDVCGNGVDENCDGTADNETDQDADGWTNCGGDCCDSTNEGCQEPEKVNPGAIEVDGNDLDDDCDGNVDNAVAQLCDNGLTSNSADPTDYARAIELCNTATESDANWGVISARFVRADGTGAPNNDQKAIRPAFGSTMVQAGGSMTVISTANAAATGQTNPPFASWDDTDHGTTSGYPADWYAANGNSLPNVAGCPEPSPFATGAFDPVMYEMRIRTPSNAQSFSMRVNFMSAEFPEYTCSPFNDFFVVLLDSGWNGNPPNPADKNLAFYVNPANAIYPVGVNLAYGDTGLFQVCRNGSTGCLGTAGTISTCTSDAELNGTGMEVGAPGSCDANAQIGGGTGWLTTSGNVNGAEIITLRIALWDTSDGILNSVALIDNFQWSLDPSDPGTVIDVD